MSTVIYEKGVSSCLDTACISSLICSRGLYEIE